MKADPANKVYQQLVNDIQDRKSQLVKRLTDAEAQREKAENELARLRGSRRGPQTDEEFQAAEEKARAEEKAALEAAQNAYLDALKNHDKLQRDISENGVVVESQAKLIDAQGTIDRAEGQLHFLQNDLGPARRMRSLYRQKELAMQKEVNAITKVIATLSQLLQP